MDKKEKNLKSTLEEIEAELKPFVEKHGLKFMIFGDDTGFITALPCQCESCITAFRQALLVSLSKVGKVKIVPASLNMMDGKDEILH